MIGSANNSGIEQNFNLGYTSSKTVWLAKHNDSIIRIPKSLQVEFYTKEKQKVRLSVVYSCQKTKDNNI